MIIGTIADKGRQKSREIKNGFMALWGDGALVLQCKMNGVINKVASLSCTAYARHALTGALKQPCRAMSIRYGDGEHDRNPTSSRA